MTPSNHIDRPEDFNKSKSATVAQQSLGSQLISVYEPRDFGRLQCSRSILPQPLTAKHAGKMTINLPRRVAKDLE